MVEAEIKEETVEEAVEGTVELAGAVELAETTPVPVPYPVGSTNFLGYAVIICDPFTVSRVEFAKLKNAATGVSFNGTRFREDTHKRQEKRKQERRK